MCSWLTAQGPQKPSHHPATAATFTADLPLAAADGQGIGLLPRSLGEALDAMEKSELVADALGEHTFEWFIRHKRDEWGAYKQHVSEFEIDRYLGTL